jgi:PEP-CTERM motif
MRTRNGAQLRLVLLTAMLALCASATEAAPISWDISVFNLTGVLSGNTYSGTVTVDESYVLPGAQLLTPSNSDLRIVFDFVDDDGVTPRRFTEADDVDYPGFPSFSLQNGVPVPHPTSPPEPPKGPLSFVYFDENFNELWEFGSFTYHFNGGGTGESSLTRTSAAPVPEPATLVLVGIGLGAQAYRRRKTRDRSNT